MPTVRRMMAAAAALWFGFGTQGGPEVDHGLEQKVMLPPNSLVGQK